MLLLRLSGLFLLRLATRQLLALLFHNPPRMRPVLRAEDKMECPGSHRDRDHFCFNPRPIRSFGFADFVVRLQAQEIAFGQTEIPLQAQRGIGRDAPPLLDNRVDSRRRDMDILRQTIGADAHGLQKLFLQHFAGRAERDLFVFSLHTQ